jgi:hypothetical protein
MSFAQAISRVVHRGSQRGTMRKRLPGLQPMSDATQAVGVTAEMNLTNAPDAFLSPGIGGYESGEHFVELRARAAGPKHIEAAMFDFFRRRDCGGPYHPGEGSAQADAAHAGVRELCKAEARAHHDDVERQASHHLSDGVGITDARRVDAVGAGESDEFVDGWLESRRVEEQPLRPCDFFRKDDVLMVTKIDQLAKSIGDPQDIGRGGASARS